MTFHGVVDIVFVLVRCPCCIPMPLRWWGPSRTSALCRSGRHERRADCRLHILLYYHTTPHRTAWYGLPYLVSVLIRCWLVLAICCGQIGALQVAHLAGRLATRLKNEQTELGITEQDVRSLQQPFSDHLSRISQLCTTLHTPCGVFNFVPRLVGS